MADAETIRQGEQQEGTAPTETSFEGNDGSESLSQDPDVEKSLLRPDGDSADIAAFDVDDPSGSEMTWSGSLRAPLSKLQLVGLNSYMVGWSALWTCMLVVTIPHQVEVIVGDDYKGSGVSAIMVVGGLVSICLPPLIGWLSDRTSSIWGPRRPYIGAGVVLTSAVILLVPLCNTLGGLCALWFFVQVFSNLGSNTFMALIPDVVPSTQRGISSGYLGAFSCLGQFLGAAIGVSVEDVGLGYVYLMLALLHVLTALPTLIMVRDAKAADSKLTSVSRGNKIMVVDVSCSCAPSGQGCCDVISSVLEPFRMSSDFTWVYVTRVLMNMGQYTVQEFLEYYLQDLIPLGSMTATRAVSILLMPLLFSALIAAFVGGNLSDWLGGHRKIFVYVSGLTMAVMCCASIFNRYFGVSIVISIFFGAAFGLFGAVDFAIICDVLPSKDDQARDMAIWHTSLVVPQVLASPIAGGALDALNRSYGPSVGYAFLFGLACFYFLLGAGLISRVRSIK